MATAFPLATDKWVSDRPMLPVEKLPVLPEEICVGSVVWLRQRFSKDEDITCVRRGHYRNFKLEKEGYRHPLVILKVWQRSGSAEPEDLMLGVSDVGCCQSFLAVTLSLYFFSPK
jgi:hypothetical protein